MALNTRYNVGVSAHLSNALDLGAANADVGKRWSIDLANGTAAGQVDRIYQDTNTLVASTSTVVDLAGTLTDPYGQTISFAKVKKLVVAAAAGNTNNVIVGGAASNTWVGPFGAATHTVAVRPGEVKVVVACGESDANGYAVTAGTGDQLQIANGGGTTGVTYDLWIEGTSA